MELYILTAGNGAFILVVVMVVMLAVVVMLCCRCLWFCYWVIFGFRKEKQLGAHIIGVCCYR
jgi:hypothetical protein